MRKIYYFIISILLMVSCQKRQEPLPYVPITVDIAPIVVLPADTAAIALRQQHLKKELDYYLQRHSVEDEGYDMVARYAEKGDSLLASYMPEGKPTLLGMFKWKSYQRQGFGLKCDKSGRVFIGTWVADTMPSGLRIDSAGIYAGEFDRYLQASGHGCYSSFDGNYYEGHWLNDKREGFGFAVSATNLQAGTWRAGRFHGERIQHTSDRIYGIDLSRYQHEKGRRHFGINWKQLRITNLGRRIKGNIRGEVDYPVRFVFVKSTQGTTIRNRYYANDYIAARKQGIPVGAYHFFSTLQNGYAQANYFLMNTLFRHGDLPPVLDVEPTDKQIEKMGGTEKLLNEIRVWISTVERRLHVRPILYVNQRFINKYLTEAPDLLDNYLVWIARYGEYKPGLHLAFWQLSADSRVKGIQTDVDVNVFNGYEPHWEEFLKEETIKRPSNR